MLYVLHTYDLQFYKDTVDGIDIVIVTVIDIKLYFLFK